MPGAEWGLGGIPAGGAVDSKAGRTGCADGPSALSHIGAPGQSSQAAKGEVRHVKRSRVLNKPISSLPASV